MTTDLSMLTWTVGITALFWVPYILARIVQYGPVAALSYKADSKPVAAWAERAKKAHYNAVENLVLFGTLVIVAHLTGSANDATAAAAITYFWARLAHYPLYISGVPLARTLTFVIGWLAQVCIFYQIVT